LSGRAVEALSTIEQVKQIKADYDVSLNEAKRIFACLIEYVVQK
jgi:hypothetical protein